MLARTRATSSSRPTGLNKILRLVCPSVHSQHLDPGTSPDRTMHSFFGITTALLISWIPYLTHSFSIPCHLTSFATDNHRKSHHVPKRALRMMFRNDDDGSSAAVDRLVGTVLLGGALLVGGGVGLVSGADVVRADVSISPRCIDGEGPQCEDLAEGNELIKTLQARSSQNKEKYIQESLETYNDHNFKDYFRAENKHMVRHKDGKYEILTNQAYDEAERAGRVKNDKFLNE